MSQDALLRSTLNAQILSAPGFPTAVDLENTPGSDGRTPFKPPVGSTWARITHRFGVEQLKTLPAPGGRLLRSGFCQVDLFVPLLSGTTPLDDLAQSVRDTCPPNLVLSVGGRRFTVTASQRSGAARDAGWWWDHVDIYWTLWAVNPLAG